MPRTSASVAVTEPFTLQHLLQPVHSKLKPSRAYHGRRPEEGWSAVVEKTEAKIRRKRKYSLDGTIMHADHKSRKF